MIQTTPSMTAPVRLPADELVETPSELRRALRSLFKARWPLLALIVLGIVGFFALFGPNIAPKDPNRQTLRARLTPPMFAAETPNPDYPLGSDALGRDVLSRLIYGARVSISVGLAAVLLGGFVGISLGMIAGYFGGFLDDLIMRIADIQLGFPFILLAIMVLVVLGQSVANLVIVLGIGQWVTYARIARGSTIAEREREHITASRAMGANNARILLRGILPNITAPLIVIASFNVASVILSEATLSFLGLGVPPTVPTWGGMLAESRDQLLGGSWWLAVFPGLCIVLTVLSLNVLGDWLRDFLDPRLRGSR
ncbi:ABC transporter permease [Aggregatilineales bacterium SYSU G02658]